MTNIARSKELVRSLFAQGVREVCVCAGSRNSPLVTALDKASLIRKFSCFEERSAAFFALGRIKLEKRPVAIVTTSGTAAAELLPAVIEAYYSALPLVVITADRPPEYRGSGSPQTIEQVGLYSHYASTEDLTAASSWSGPLTPNGPTHLNICFDEPLLDEFVEAFELADLKPLAVPAPKPNKVRLPAMKKPLVLLGRLSRHNQKTVEAALAPLKLPVVAEGPSGLRESPLLATLKSGDGILKTKLAKEFDGVIRIGSVPTLRFWRDLEKLSLPVVNFSEEPFLGLTRGELSCGSQLDLSSLSELSIASGFADSLLVLDQLQQARLQKILKEEPLSEPGWFHSLSKRIPSGSHVYVGNSLPIREWDLAAQYEPKNFRLEVSRGANGIDGQISTFLGASSPHQENWGVFGDLTTLYDLVAPWMDSQLEPHLSRIVVINNFGGQIFSRLFQSPSFLNLHQMEFEHWARLWRRGYRCWRQAEQIESVLSEREVIEVQPDAGSSQTFWRKYGELWANL